MKTPSEQAALVACIDPDAYAAATAGVVSDYVNTEYWHQLKALVMVGTVAASGTVDAALLQATSSTGAGAKAITGKSITQMDTGSADKQAVINLKTDELDVAGGFKFVALKITTGTASVDNGGIILGFNPRQGPANDNDLASVAEIVA